MRIDSSNIGMESARSYHASNTSNKRFSITEYRQGALSFMNNSLNTAVSAGQGGNSQALEESKEGQTEGASKERLYTVEDWRRGLGLSTGRANLHSARSTNSVIDDFRQATIRYIFDLLFSVRRSRWNSQTDETDASVDSVPENSSGVNGTKGNVPGGIDPSQNVAGLFGTKLRVLTFSEEQVYFEQESTSFSTTGTVRTADGREIHFNVDIGMSRQFQQTFKQELQLSAANMCDPLVINLDTDIAELSDQKFFFDIDADGEMDEISALDGRSGYLALDKNGDGIINDGSELFGTASGDGFADLAKYDEDGNGWIDENDAIWSKLKIWCKDADGRDVLYRLADKGVGAICLQRASTDFTLQGAQGQKNGAIRSTGVFLYENGNVGTVQHVDVAKYEQGA